MVTIGYHQIRPEIFENPLFSTQLKGMRTYGFIIGLNQRYQNWHFLRCIVLTLSVIGSCYLIFVKVSRGFENLEDGATSWATAFLYLSTSIAVTNAYFQRKRVVIMVNFVHDDLLLLRSKSDDIEEKLFAKTVKYLRLITFILWTPSVVAGGIAYVDCFYRTIFMPDTVFNVPQILNGTAQPILLFKLFPFGEVYDNILIGYLGPCYALLLGITTIPLWHTFIACLMEYVIFKFQIINKRLEDMDISKLVGNSQKAKDLPEEERSYWRLKMCEFCVKEQVKIRWFIQELQALIRIPVFLDFIIFSVLICFLFYALTTGTPSKMDYFFMFIYLFVMSSILWLYHWHATLVAESNDDLRFAIYSCDWYNYPLKVQKSIRLIMMESATPLHMRAIFVPLDLKTFIDIVRGAYSYFSILRNANVN